MPDPKSKQYWEDQQRQWWKEDARQLNTIGENLRAEGIGVGTAVTTPPLNSNGSLKEDDSSPVPFDDPTDNSF